MTPINIVKPSPEKILAIYSTGGNNFYLETHLVRNGKVMAGKPSTPHTLREMAKVILNKDVDQPLTFNGLKSNKILAFSQRNGKKTLLWSVPAQVRDMYFTSTLGIPNGKACQPNLIFFLEGKSLNVFAIKESNITPETKLFIAPYHNISANGSVCLGTIRPKNFSNLDALAIHWEGLFFNSYFSHAGGLHQKLTFNINHFWKNVIISQTPFPDEILIPATQFNTVDSLLKVFNFNE